MSALRRPVWSLVLACCLLMQAVSAAMAMAMACGPQHEPVASLSMPPCHEAAASESADGADSPDSTAAPVSHTCSACAACLLGSALPVRVAVPQPPPATLTAPPPSAVPALSFLADGPERPPRRAPPAR
ncbi:MAG: hypothetical protein KGQ67_08310 [Betaproteobacteria bacterium]|nr:hypothetical protein [Betaproteobacteria bacterium]